jgi:hypothetical protein
MSKSAITHMKIGKLVLVAALAVMFLGAATFSNVQAKPKKAKYGTVKILSTPAGLPISVDGKAYGVTATDYRSIDLDPGLHTIVVVLPDGQRWTREFDLPAGRIKCIAVNYRPSPPPPPKSPCPFPVNVSAPTQVNEGEIITYTADVSYSGTSTLLYTWSLNPGNARIVSGAGTPTITVDSTGLAGQRITATLLVDDGSGDASCRQTSQVATNIPPAEKRVVTGREFDTCCGCSYDDLKARLDNLAVELQNDPSTTTYIFAYGGRTSPSGQAGRLLARSRDYLINDRGIDASRIIQVNGGFREEDCVEVWIVPRGAAAPQPSPTVGPSEVRPAPQAAPRRRPRG